MQCKLTKTMDRSTELRLPDDMLANVLGRLPPRSLAASRCVRKHWCSIIDARRLLRADLLPLRLDAFFCNPSDLGYRPTFFARPSTIRRIAGHRLDFSDALKKYPPYLYIADHCNGLLLFWGNVVNPATRQCVTLPPFPEATMPMTHMEEDDLDLSPCFYLAYDPMESPQHYEVFLVPTLHSNRDDDDNDGGIKSLEQDLSEWPPSPYTTQVFSSKKWRWEERSFVRQGEPAGTIADMVCSDRDDRQAVYFRGALYVHCQNDSVMRIALSNDKYQVIKSPTAGAELGEYTLSYLGKSEKGVYSALLRQDGDSLPHFQVWLLNELCGQMEWVLKTEMSLVDNIPLHLTNKYSKPWTVSYKKEEAYDEQEELDEWDFDDGIVLETKDNKPNKPYCYGMVFLGFHPYKEIAFFCVPSSKSSRVISYHLNTPKVQELGAMNVSELETSFPYTECWMGELFENN